MYLHRRLWQLSQGSDEMCECRLWYTAKHWICGAVTSELDHRTQNTLTALHCTELHSSSFSLCDLISMDLCWFHRSNMANFLAQFQTIKNTSDRLVISGNSLLLPATWDLISFLSTFQVFTRCKIIAYKCSFSYFPFLRIYLCILNRDI